MKGKIIFFDFRRKFGFIESEGKSYFFGLGSFDALKFKDIRKALKEDAVCTFELKDDPKGPVAVNLLLA